jgi:hypothetical protein
LDYCDQALSLDNFIRNNLVHPTGVLSSSTIQTFFDVGHRILFSKNKDISNPNTKQQVVSAFNGMYPPFSTHISHLTVLVRLLWSENSDEKMRGAIIGVVMDWMSVKDFWPELRIIVNKILSVPKTLSEQNPKAWDSLSKVNAEALWRAAEGMTLQPGSAILDSGIMQAMATATPFLHSCFAETVFPTFLLKILEPQFMETMTPLVASLVSLVKEETHRHILPLYFNNVFVGLFQQLSLGQIQDSEHVLQILRVIVSNLSSA